MKYIITIVFPIVAMVTFVGHGKRMYDLAWYLAVAQVVLGIIGYYGFMAIVLKCDIKDVNKNKSELAAYKQTILDVGLLIWISVLMLTYTVSYMKYNNVTN